MKRITKEDRLAAKLGSQVALKEQIESYREQIQTLDDKIRELVEPELEKKFGYSVGYSLGVHECNKSPYGFCTYDHVEDPRWDFCVFCGDPHERK